MKCLGIGNGITGLSNTLNFTKRVKMNNIITVKGVLFLNKRSTYSVLADWLQSYKTSWAIVANRITATG